VLTEILGLCDELKVRDQAGEVIGATSPAVSGGP